MRVIMCRMRVVLITVLACGVITAAGDTDFARVRSVARAEIEAGTMPGLAVAVVHRGRVVFTEAFGTANVETGVPMTSDTVFQVGSVGKMLTAAAVLETAADGKISLQDPVSRAVTGLDPVIGALTPHQLLAQVSGLRDMPGAHGEQGDDAHGRFLRTLRAADRILQPGQSFSYSNIGYSLAGYAAAEASGVAFADLVHRRVFAPIRMTRSTLRPVEAMTWPLAMGHKKNAEGRFAVVRPMAHDTRLWPAGYVFTNAADLSRFAIAFLDEGRVDGQQALRPETPRAMQSAHARLPNLYDDGQYGYATFQFTMRGQRVAEHAGSMPGFAALLRTVPAEEFAVIALANGEVPAVKTAEAAMETLLELTPPVPFTSDGPPAAIDDSEMAALTGRYENRWRYVMSVENGSLVLRQDDGPPLVVSKVGANRYVAVGPGDRPRLRFLVSPAAEGRPGYLHFALWAFRKVS
jgi:CubicO group peptidase (beta-lactamase class C family)